MNFIFPQNYNFKNKFFGFIDYSTLLINLIWIAIVYFFTSIFCINLSSQISIIIILCFPLLLFSIFGVNNENILNIIVYLIKYCIKPKLYIFYK